MKGLPLFIFLILPVVFSSCVANKMAGDPAPMSKFEPERYEGKVHAPYETIWEAARAVLTERANLTSVNADTGYMRGETGSHYYDVRLTQIVYNSGLVAVKVCEWSGKTCDIPAAKGLYDAIHVRVSGN